ncbi:site-specific DNA-methyltransferase [uncultured Dialister sp.]|uniref:site-specific DNA-methyltransferase n=1 Tax=uncultured Dialister sp. TaxID=278064 RepID=UPI00262B79E8|nr:site-specific DNA-methyltransferase [uncultured Dialister sp.]
MDKLKMHTPDLAEENYKKLAALFPDAVTETKDENGNTVRAIDKDVLMQEINAKVVDDGQERYQFTWPDKRKAVVLANAPIAKTLRFKKEKSVGRDGTPGGTDSENIYIEGDNLDALKLLQETYLGKVKMIYIDPPYNTGNDFIYEDDFSQKAEDYAENSGQTDEEGNRLVQNAESNGRFHTDWLNMLYPRLRIAKDLLTEDGVIFISIDDNEQENLKKICDEIFGSQNFVFQIAWRRTDNQPNIGKIARVKEYILCFAKNISLLGLGKLPLTDKAKAEYRYQDEKGLFRRAILLDKTRGRYHYPVTTKSGNVLNGPWMKTEKEFRALDSKGAIYWTSGGDEQPYGKIYLSESKGAIPNDFWGIEYGTNQRASLEVERLFEKRCFDFPKPVSLISALLTLGTEEDSIVIDFFSGSATTAQATMQVNAENRGNRKFILVQLPERCDSKSQAFKEGYKTICDIGEERIRRAGKKIKEETGADIDYGFRCFRVDSSNMKDVYYKPSDAKQAELDLFTDNIKEDRTPEDLLIQVMLDLGVLLSSKVEEEEIAGKKVFSVADGYLIACFDRDVTDDVVTAIAKKHPFYTVFRDSSFSSDSVAANFEQIFDTYSPQTVRKVL